MIITIKNEAGGVGKTTSAILLAEGFALEGHRTLLMDLAPWGNVSINLPNPKKLEHVNEIHMCQPIESYAHEYDTNLWAIAGNGVGLNIAQQLQQSYAPRTDFEKLLKYSSFEIIILDTGPRDSYCGDLALLVADWIMIPTTLNQHSFDAIADVIHDIQEKTKQRDTPLLGYCIVPMFFTWVDNVSKTQIKKLHEIYGDLVWECVPKDEHAHWIYANKQNLWKKSPKTPILEGRLVNGQKIGGFRKILHRLIEINETIKGKG